MSVPIEFDRRFKVNQDIVNEMRLLRKRGITCRKIAKIYNVNETTVIYWTNAEYRRRKQLRSAKKRHGGKLHSINVWERRKRQKEEYPISYIEHLVYNSKFEKRCKRHNIYGLSIKEWKRILKKYKIGRQKVI